MLKNVYKMNILPVRLVLKSLAIKQKYNVKFSSDQ
jgi:hypothetical protein